MTHELGDNLDGFSRQRSEIFEWNFKYLMNIGVFSAMALALVLPTGAGGGLILLVCSIAYLVCCRNQSDPLVLARYELCFLGSMTLYPLAVVFNNLASVEPITWRYFDNSVRFLIALPVYWAIRKSRITFDTLVMGAIIGAAGAGILAMYQWMILGDERPNGFTNELPFSHISMFLICIALTPISLSRTWYWLKICGIGLGIFAVLLPQVRGTWVALLILIWLITDWFPNRQAKRKWRAVSAVVFAAGLLLLAFHMQLISLVNEETRYQEDTVESKQSGRIVSAYCRLDLWRAGWILFSEHPWSGVGFGQYGSEARKLEEAGRVHLTSCIHADYESLKHAHNDFVQIGATMGGPSILAYLLPLIFLYVTGHHFCRQHARDVGVVLKLYAVGQGLISLTQSQLNHNISTTFFAFTAVSLVALAFNRIEARKRLCP